MIHERDRQTDGQTDRMTAIAALMHSIARQKSHKIRDFKVKVKERIGYLRQRRR